MIKHILLSDFNNGFLLVYGRGKGGTNTFPLAFSTCRGVVSTKLTNSTGEQYKYDQRVHTITNTTFVLYNDSNYSSYYVAYGKGI